MDAHGINSIRKSILLKLLAERKGSFTTEDTEGIERGKTQTSRFSQSTRCALVSEADRW